MSKPTKSPRRVFIDMDGVIVDFAGKMQELGLSGDELKKIPGAYAQMEPIKGAIEAVNSIIGMGYEVWIATKPPTGVAYAYADKVSWVLEHLPALKRRIIITHHKGMLGDDRDFLLDDRPHRAFCSEFKGTLLAFVDEYHWPQALAALREARDQDHSAADMSDMSHINYIVYPGNAQSRIDGDKHFVSYERLVALYGVDPRQCVHNAHHKFGDTFPERIRHLYPDYSGDYKIEDRV